MGTEEINFESSPIPNIDNMGREKLQEDGWALKLFKEQCCDSCSCKN